MFREVQPNYPGGSMVGIYLLTLENNISDSVFISNIKRQEKEIKNDYLGLFPNQINLGKIPLRAPRKVR